MALPSPDPSPFWHRFWSAVTVNKPAECWPWTDRWSDKDGYGILTVGGAHQRAHRVAWSLTNGPIPTSLSVLHRCDNPPCCNPAHLYLGTQAENVADMMARHRRERLASQRAQVSGQLSMID